MPQQPHLRHAKLSFPSPVSHRTRQTTSPCPIPSSNKPFVQLMPLLAAFLYTHKLTHLQQSVPWWPAHTEGDGWVMTMDYFIIPPLTGWQGAYMVLPLTSWTQGGQKGGNAAKARLRVAVTYVSPKCLPFLMKFRCGLLYSFLIRAVTEAKIYC